MRADLEQAWRTAWAQDGLVKNGAVWVPACNLYAWECGVVFDVDPADPSHTMVTGHRTADAVRDEELVAIIERLWSGEWGAPRKPQ